MLGDFRHMASEDALVAHLRNEHDVDELGRIDRKRVEQSVQGRSTSVGLNDAGEKLSIS